MLQFSYRRLGEFGMTLRRRIVGQELRSGDGAMASHWRLLRPPRDSSSTNSIGQDLPAAFPLSMYMAGDVPARLCTLALQICLRADG